MNGAVWYGAVRYVLYVRYVRCCAVSPVVLLCVVCRHSPAPACHHIPCKLLERVGITHFRLVLKVIVQFYNYIGCQTLNPLAGSNPPNTLTDSLDKKKTGDMKENSRVFINAVQNH